MCHSPTRDEEAASRARRAMLDREAPRPWKDGDETSPAPWNTSPRGNGEADEREVRSGLEKLSMIVG